MYVVFGATGQTGSAVADVLLEKNQSVRVVLRSDKTAAAWQAKGADVAFADLGDLAAMTNAMRNADAVYAMNPPAYTVADMFAVAKGIGERYVAAIKNSGAQKVVLLSSVGSQQASGTGNILTTHILETMFGDLEIPVAFLRASAFIENWGSGAKIAAEQGILPSFYTPLERKIPMVCAADIGHAVAQAMTADWTGQRIIELHGAAEYSPNDIAAAFAAALGHDVQAVTIPESDWQATIARFGFSPEAVNSYSEMMRGFNSGHIIFEGGSYVQTVRGQTLLSDVASKLIEAQA